MKESSQAPEVACSLNDEEFQERRSLARETLLPHLTLARGRARGKLVLEGF